MVFTGTSYFRTLHFTTLAVIRQFGLNYMQYADDTQVYIAADRTYSRQLASLEECLSAVNTWLRHNLLCLNPAKSDVIVFTTSRQQHTITSILYTMIQYQFLVNQSFRPQL